MRYSLHWFFKVWIVIVALFLIGFVFSIVLPKTLPNKIVSGEIKGIIFQNQIWRGTIIVDGDLIALPNVTIKIEPGTLVYISKKGDKNNLDFLPWHLKYGINTLGDERGILKGEPFWDEKEKVFFWVFNLKALGEDQRPIIITSLGEQGSAYDINLIKIENGEISKVNFSNYRRLEIGLDVKITESTFTNTGECSLCISSGNPLIKDNTFQKGKKFYMDVENGSPLITGNKFLESEGNGVIFRSLPGNSIRIFNNLFQMPSRKAIIVNSINLDGDMAGNNFILGDIQIPCQSRVNLINNLIRAKLIFFNIGGCSGEYTILENYWEIEDQQSILNARVAGITDKFKVKIPRVLKNPPHFTYSI